MKRSSKRAIRGQAMAELVVICIPILMVFVGAWLMMLVGRDKIQLYIENRGETDETAMVSASTGGGEHIVGWDYGNDGIPFTNDDMAEYGGADEAGFFSSQLNTEELTVPQIRGMLRHDLNNFIASPLFVVGAELCNTSTRRPILQSFDDDASTILTTVRKLFGSDLSGDIIEDVYMPAMSK